MGGQRAEAPQEQKVQNRMVKNGAAAEVEVEIENNSASRRRGSDTRMR